MKRFLSIIILIIGLVALGSITAACLGQGIAEAFTGFAATPAIICLVIGVSLTFLGIFGNIRLNRKEKTLSGAEAAARKKKNRRIYIFTGILTATAAVLICVIAGWPSIEKQLAQIKENKQITVAEILNFDPDIELTGGTVSMPDGARYLLYDADKHSFELEPKTQLLDRVTSNPKKASVLVRYKITTDNIGAWYTQSNIYIAQAYEQTIHIDVIRIEDRSLIDSIEITAAHSEDNLDDGYTYKINIYSEEAVKYLNNLFG